MRSPSEPVQASRRMVPHLLEEFQDRSIQWTCIVGRQKTQIVQPGQPAFQTDVGSRPATEVRTGLHDLHVRREAFSQFCQLVGV